jgi:hypothetical protein
MISNIIANKIKIANDNKLFKKTTSTGSTLAVL